ncbi:DNA-directed RNA polymerase beta' subunit (EC [Olavius algarvensis associated proteobacterium Delta 3]|nr:DNA-directed RNA polymerase beta' subunit (EC [Olavius algarvensis associated proteobacterium Delta 3]
METLYDFFAKPTDPKQYTGVRLSLSSPEQIREWSNGEIKKPETINYRTFKPERDGLFCAKIFGPTKDYECNCGKYKRMKHRGVVCEKCGVEVIQSKVRRERMAHIELATPVSHIWFLKSLPSKIGNLLDLTLKNMEKVLYFDSYIVIDPKETDLNRCQLLTDEEYMEAQEMYGNKFESGIGAEAVKALLEKIDLDALYKELKEEVRKTGSDAKRKKIAKRLKIVDAFRKSGVDPAWMIMDVIPVLPPDLRPLVPLEGGRFATSDLNDLYRRVINRNNRLKRLIDLKAPEIIVRNEKRMLQESVDVLFDNGRHGRVITGTNKRPLKSLSDTLKGKQGRFRQNLLGKRVDYSGRTVITIGPNLRLHQCGLPKKMALELFKPFIYYRLEQKGLVSTVKSAKKMVEREVPEVWDTLDEVVKEYPVMLNRAPTLHRLGVQAFEPLLIEGKAIQLHPLVCTAFNADFDGDQMAVHVPLSVESQIEARALMLSSNNILSPANGSPIIVPTQDIVLGCYYMTRSIAGAKGHGMVFSSPDEVRVAYDAGEADLHARIVVRMGEKRVDTTVGRILMWEIIPKESIMKLRHIRCEEKSDAEAVYVELAGGSDFTNMVQKYSSAPDREFDGLIGWLRKDEFTRLFRTSDEDTEAVFGQEPGATSDIVSIDDAYHIFQVVERRPEIPFHLINKVQDKKSLRELVDYAYRNIGPKATVILSDRLKDLGYAYSTTGGLSISIDAMIIPEAKWDLLSAAEHQVQEIQRQYTEGLITQGEKYNKVVDIWAKATDDVANEMMEVMKMGPVFDKTGQPVTDDDGKQLIEESFNPIYMMADSGARGSKDQMRQLAGMRGLMAKPSGEIIETPIQANFREGLSVLQYFISTHGARKGLADTALKTANSGYLTRRLADVAQDCVITEPDCGTTLGVEVEALTEGGEVIQRLGERILGRVAAEEILDPFTDEVLVDAGEDIDEAASELIENAGATRAMIRSVLTCKSRYGVCAKCYGRDLAHGQPVEIGQAVGILAAQSIGEPGTQLTMRTFHIGGTASRRVEQADIRARIDGTIKYLDLNLVEVQKNEFVVMNRRGGEFAIMGETGRERERYPVIYGAHLLAKDGDAVKAGDLLAVWDPFTTPIIAEVGGTVKFGDITAGKTMQEKVDPVTGKSSRTIIESKSSDVRPRVSIKNDDGKTRKLPTSSGQARYVLPVDAVIMVEEGNAIKAGDILAKLSRATTKTKDITGGLPRVAELFEVRKPKEAAVLSEIDGYVSISKGTKKGKQKITITPVDVGEKKEYLIPRGKHINVYEGDYVRAGEELVGGAAIPQDILNIKGEVALARYLTDEVQEVYRLQGVRINDKHIEVIVRQMMRRVKVLDVGDSDLILEEQVDRAVFEEVNQEVIADGGKAAVAEPLILGITKASLSTDSFISAASFQETTKVLTDASIAGSVDHLRGLKENVIMGRLIPAGTGLVQYRGLEIDVG